MKEEQLAKLTVTKKRIYQVKIFFEHWEADDLESAVNEFLREIGPDRLVSIEFRPVSCQVWSGKGTDGCYRPATEYLAMVVYRETVEAENGKTG